MEEQQLEIQEKGQYKNINVKTTYKWSQKDGFELDENDEKIVSKQGIKPGHYIDVVKNFVDGKEIAGRYGVSYSCSVKYGGEDVTFWLDERYHKQFASTGGVGDTVRISCEVQNILNKKLGVKVPVEVLKFEVV